MCLYKVISSLGHSIFAVRDYFLNREGAKTAKKSFFGLEIRIG